MKKRLIAFTVIIIIAIITIGILQKDELHETGTIAKEVAPISA